MRLLVLSADYPRPDGYVAQYFIHTRNKEYVKQNLDVSVLSFSAKDNYIIDGVKVFTYDYFKKKLINQNFDILVSHAPNLKNHYLFLKKYKKNFSRFVFFFHGGEVLKTKQIYPKPYDYVKKKSILSTFFKNIYDSIKLVIWKRYFTKYADESKFVFVSSWMYEKFLKHLKIDPQTINNKSYIIYNSCGYQFQIENYDLNVEKEFDFITIRNILDKSKYCIDVVNRMAKDNPEYKFCVIGKGDFFKYNQKADNLVFINKHLSHEKVIEYLNKSKYALMPTRADAQGVMACEMATFGIPLITSNIDVCKEVLGDFGNVYFIDNDEKINVESLNLKFQHYQKNKKFFTENTVFKEIELFRDFMGQM